MGKNTGASGALPKPASDKLMASAARRTQDASVTRGFVFVQTSSESAQLATQTLYF